MCLLQRLTRVGARPDVRLAREVGDSEPLPTELAKAHIHPEVEQSLTPNPRTTTMTPLHDGTVLIEDGNPRGRSSYILDPTRGTYSTAAPRRAGLVWHPVVLDDGRILFRRGERAR